MGEKKQSVGKTIGNVIGSIFKFFMDIAIGIGNVFVKMMDEQEKNHKKNGKKTRKSSKRK